MNIPIPQWGDLTSMDDLKSRVADLSQLILTSIRFQHSQRHMLTWYSSGGRTAHQIDRILLCSRWSLSFGNCHAHIGRITRIANETVYGRLRLRLSARQKTQSHRGLDVSNLTIPDYFQVLRRAITSRLSGIDDGDKLNELWTELKISIANTSIEELDNSKGNKKDRISSETLNRCVWARDVRLYNSSDWHTLRRQAVLSSRNFRKRCRHEIADRVASAVTFGDSEEPSQLTSLFGQDITSSPHPSRRQWPPHLDMQSEDGANTTADRSITFPSSPSVWHDSDSRVLFTKMVFAYRLPLAYKRVITLPCLHFKRGLFQAA